MAQHPLRKTSQHPSITTVAGYYRSGRSRLRTAITRWPDLKPALALIMLHEMGGTLRPSSVRTYFEQDRRTLALVLRFAGQSHRLNDLTVRLKTALWARKGRPEKPRTASKKVIDATEDECIALFYELKRAGLESGRLNTVSAGLYVLVANYVGLRPVELIGARYEAGRLILLNAKRGDRHLPERVLDLTELDPDVGRAVALLIDIMPQFKSRKHFNEWRNSLREIIRVACKRIGIRALSLYSFRHVAIATWSRAGVGPDDIARLAGHISPKTALTHYARSRVWHVRKAVARPDPDFAHREVGPVTAPAKVIAPNGVATPGPVTPASEPGAPGAPGSVKGEWPGFGANDDLEQIEKRHEKPAARVKKEELKSPRIQDYYRETGNEVAAFIERKGWKGFSPHQQPADTPNDQSTKGAPSEGSGTDGKG